LKDTVAQQENAPNKPVHLMFLVGVIALFYVLQWGIDWIWGYFGTAPSKTRISLASAGIATLIGVVMYRSDKYYHLANEVASELKKVTWPTRQELKESTIVVIVSTFIVTIFIGVVDQIISRVIRLVLG